MPNIQDGTEVDLVATWPGQQGADTSLFEKVPSKLAHSRDEEDTVKTLWGYEVKPSPTTTIYSWTKLLLDEDTHRPDYEQNGRSASPEERDLYVLPPGKTAVDVVTEYLRHLYNHCMTILERRCDAVLQVTPIEFWFTMPAIWSDRAQQATQQAAKNAGFGSRQGDTVHMITEPEAGVLAAIKTQVKATRELLEVTNQSVHERYSV